MLQQEKAEDYVLTTGVTTTVRDFIRKSFNYLGIEIEFEGNELEGKGVIVKCTNSQYQLAEGTGQTHLKNNRQIVDN